MVMWMRQHRQDIISILKKGMLMLVLLLLVGCGDGEINTETLETKVENCWPCVLYERTFTTINYLVYTLYPILCRQALAVMSVGLLFWLAFKSLKLVTSVIQPNIHQYIHEVMSALFKAIIVSVILLSGDSFLCVINLFLEPVILSFSLISRVILLEVVPAEESIVVLETGKAFLPAYATFVAPLEESQCMVFTEVISKNLQAVIYQVYSSLDSGTSLGWTLMVDGNVVSFLLGLFFVWPAFFMLSLIFPWMFAESFFRAGAVIILLPFILTAWIFPSTKQMVKAGWDVIFGSMVSILMACIYIALAITVLRTFAENSDMFKFIFGQARQSADPSLLRAIRRLSTEAVAFFALIIIIIKFHKMLPNISGYFGGDSHRSEIVSVFGGLKKFAINLTMLAVGLILAAFGVPGGDRLVKVGAERIKDQTIKQVKKTAKETTNSGESS